MLKKALLLLVLAGAIGAFLWSRQRPVETRDHIIIYGNVDLRQVSLAFNNSERIAAVLVQEGDRVHAGQTLARLDTSRLMPRVAEVEGLTLAQQQALKRLHNGSRPEEIAEARANLEAARADADYARQQYQRLTGLSRESSGKAVSVQDLDYSRAAMTSAEAKFNALNKALDLLVIGPRREDIDQADAQYQSLSGQLGYLRQQLKDAELRAPSEAIVRSRLLEPGEMSSPQRPVYTLALVDPKWVRTYVSETDLGLVHPGMKAEIRVDGFPGRAYEGWVGFISSVAEFTPKSVQTEELRPTLSYEVRVFVKDASDDLRLGMPATVSIPIPSRAATH